MTPTAKPDAELAVTEADVAAAEQDAAAAEEAAADLERAIVEGDETITADQLAAQKSLGTFARLRAASVARKHEKAKEAARLAAAQQLHKDVHAYSDAIADELRDRLQAVVAANQAFTDAVEAHQDKVLDMVRRAHELDIPEHDGLPMPPAEHGHLAIPKAGGAAIRAGLLELGSAGDPKVILTLLADRPDEAAERIEGIARSAATVHPGRDSGLHWYKGQGGQVLGLAKPHTAEDVKRLGLRKLTDQEVFG